jgi:hypothetical protein
MNNTLLPQSNNNKVPFYKKPQFLFTLIAIVACALVASQVFSDKSNSNQENSNSSTVSETEATKDPKIVKKEFKKSCKSIKYKTLARNPDKYKGKNYKLTGKVIQVQEPTYGDTVGLRINITKETAKYIDYVSWSDTIYATVEIPEGEDRILEDDIITFWGTCDGLYSYTSITNSKISLPKIDIMYFNILDE